MSRKPAKKNPAGSPLPRKKNAVAGLSAPKPDGIEEIEASERIGDRAVAILRCRQDSGPSWDEYGDGPGYLLHSLRDGRWWTRFDYNEAVIKKQLSKRTSGSWKEYYSDVETAHRILADNPAHRVAGNTRFSIRRIRAAVIAALRELDARPLDELSAAIKGVRYVEERTMEDTEMILAIGKAAKRWDRVPFRREIREFLVPKDRDLSSSALGERLVSLGFGWLPGDIGARAKRVRVTKKLA